MVGKMSSENYCGDEAPDDIKLITDDNRND
jgi:hypothetical protein